MVESLSSSSSQAWLIPVSSLCIVPLRWTNIFSGPSAAPLFHDRPQFGRSREYERSFPFFFFSKFSDAWGYVLHIYGFMAVWYVSWPRVLFWSVSSSRFRWLLFQFPAFFKAKKTFYLFYFFILSLFFCVWHFWLPFSFLCVWFLWVHFCCGAFCSILFGFPPYFQVRSPSSVLFPFLVVLCSSLPHFSFFGVVYFSWMVGYTEEHFSLHHLSFCSFGGPVRFFRGPIPTDWGFHCRG